jgi:hypothetical protein
VLNRRIAVFGRMVHTWIRLEREGQWGEQLQSRHRTGGDLNMGKTYTYTARSADNPERVITFTLRDSRMSVGVGAPLEHVERAIRLGGGEEVEEEIEEEAEVEVREAERTKLWLRPLAASLVERSTRPVHVDDVVANLADDWLQVRAWIRTGGLRLIPVTLIDGRVDNPVAAQDFVEEVHERKTVSGLNVFGVLDYWATWVLAGLLALVMFQRWRRRGSDRDEA